MTVEALLEPLEEKVSSNILPIHVLVAEVAVIKDGGVFGSGDRVDGVGLRFKEI
jgi:hypothetical protein